jgi:hypothetical protein
MGSNERQWVKRTSLGNLFATHWVVPWLNLLEEFLHTWESIEDGWIWVVVCGEKITIDQTLIVK